MSSPKPRYAVDRLIGKGGMAEVYKARMTIAEGIERSVALKRVLPQLAKDPAFLGMFLDEARLSMLLHHQNIVQVFDAGKGADGYFLVMEYVEGLDLGHLSGAGGQRTPFDPRIAAFIVAEVCQALEYAHTRKTADDRPLGVIHRDVSPKNILISREGEVKLADFGLAKASSHAMRTQPGIVKGKIGYLSPEQLEGQTPDHRADVFACGIVLWELTAGRKLFEAPSDVETLMLIKKGLIPPLRDALPDVDPVFESVVMQALARHREHRFPSARALGEALWGWMFARGQQVTSWDLADIVSGKRSASTPPPRPPPAKLSFALD